MREPTDQEILDILQEECAEVIHIVSKIRRFGMEEGKLEQFESELADLSSMINWARSRGIHNFVLTPSMLEAKKQKVKKYLR